MRTALVVTSLLVLALHSSANAQLALGSDGSDGAFTFVPDTAGGSVMTIDLALASTGDWTTPSPIAGRGVYDPARWAVVFKYSVVVLPAGKTVAFANHPARAPVVWLSQGDVTISGTIDLDGADGNDAGEPLTWAEPGPGGFRGGKGNVNSAGIPTSAGFGPGGAFKNISGLLGSCAGYAVDGASSSVNQPFGRAYGSPSIPMLIGGSGGATGIQGSDGHNTHCAGAGAGAILIGSNGRLAVSGSIHANGGDSGTGSGSKGGAGSGGSIRFLADEIQIASTAAIQCLGVKTSSENTYSSPGRIRLEANAHDLATTTTPLASLGVPGTVFPPVGSPELRVLAVAGIPAPLDPRAEFDDLSADVVLDSGGSKVVSIEAKYVPVGTTVTVRVTNIDGNAIEYTSTPLSPTGVQDVTTAQATVTLPSNACAIQLRAVLP